jgi:hypothetical protein
VHHAVLVQVLHSRHQLVEDVNLAAAAAAVGWSRKQQQNSEQHTHQQVCLTIAQALLRDRTRLPSCADMCYINDMIVT